MGLATALGRCGGTGFPSASLRIIGLSFAALCAFGAVSSAVAQQAPNAANAARFVVQAWNSGNAKVYVCDSLGCSGYISNPVSIAQGPSPCVIIMSVSHSNGSVGTARMEFASATVKMDGSNHDVISISAVQAINLGSGHSNWEGRSVTFDAVVFNFGSAMNGRVFAAFTDLTKVCPDKSLGY